MRLFISFLLVFFQIINPAVFAGSKTIVKSDILEGNVADIDILGSNGHFERNAIGWAAYDDAAGDPVDATGGTSTTTCARSTSSPIDGDGSLLMTKTGGASYQGEGCALTFTVPANLSAEPLQITFEYAVASGTYTDDAVELWLYNATGSTLTQPAPTLLKNHSLNRQTYRAEFQPAYSTSAQTFRLALHIGATDTTAYTLKFDNFRVFKGRKSYGSPITDWVSFTPTGVLTTNVSYSGNWRRVGDSIEVSARILFSGANTQGAITLDLPTGLTIDTTKTAVATNVIFGSGRIYDSSTDQGYDSEVIYSSTNTVRMSRGDTTAGSAADTSVNRPITFAASDTVDFNFKVPIVGWSSSLVISSDASTRVVAAKMTSADTPTFASGVATKTTWSSTETDSHGMADLANDRFNILVPGDYEILGAYFFNSIASTLNGSIQFHARVNGSTTYIMSAIGSASGVTQYRGITGSTIIRNLKAGDYVELGITQDIVATLTAFNGLNHFSIKRISGPSQIAASEVVAGDWYKNGNTTYNGNAARQQILIDTANTDTHSMRSGNTVVIKTPGLYAIDAQAYFSGANIVSGGLYSVLVTKTTLGGTVLAGAESRAAATGAVTSCTATGIRYLVTGDILYFAVSSNQNHSASTITIDGSTAFLTKISVKRLGGL